MDRISGLISSLRIHFEDEEMPEGFHESLDMIDDENKHQQAEIKKLRDALKETILYMRDGEIEARERGTCYVNVLNQAREALKKDGE